MTARVTGSDGFTPDSETQTESKARAPGLPVSSDSDSGLSSDSYSDGRRGLSLSPGFKFNNSAQELIQSRAGGSQTDSDTRSAAARCQ